MAIIEAVETDNGHRKYRARSPATLEVIGEFECATVEDVNAAVARAREAQKSWGKLSFDERAAYMYRLLDQFIQNGEQVVDAVVAETGKPRPEALAMEVYSACDSIIYYAKRAKKFLAPEKRRIHAPLGFLKKLKVVYEPLGVVGLITPWNGPVALTANPVAQALMAGNTVVHKPSEVTPFSAEVFKRFTEAAGFPEGVYQIVQGDGQTGAALIDAGVDKVSFTGSVATGRRVGAACAERLIPFTLELGGKDAMIVCEDADMDRTVAGALFGSCMNSGHFCCGTERIYVPEKIYDEFVGRVVDATKKLRQSDNGGEADVGPVFWDKQMDIIEAHMADARAKGAKVLVGGCRNPDLKGLFYEPTVVVDVNHDMDLMTKETFGPIISIMKVKDEEEAITLANDSEYGLNGNVWTTDEEKGLRIAERIETGGVCVNDMAITYGVPEAPFGGVKHSGLGQVNGEVGIKGYAHCKPITSDRKKGKGKVQGGFPYTEKSEKELWGAIRYMMGTKIGRWFL